MEMGILRKRVCSLGLHTLVAACALVALAPTPGALAAERVVLCEEFTNLF
jgi:hypothetical protein